METVVFSGRTASVPSRGGYPSPPADPPVRLTERECEALALLADGHRNDRIAHRMSISVSTVEMHLANARRKLCARTREQALVEAIRRGLIRV